MAEDIEVEYHPNDAIEPEDDDEFFEDSSTNCEEDTELIETAPSRRRRRRRQQADKATKAVWCTKALVLIVLVLSAATSASLTYVYLESDEHEDFERTYKSNAHEIATVATQNAQVIFAGIHHFAAIFTSHIRRNKGLDHRGEPLPESFVTLPDFESFAQSTRQVVGTALMAYSPLLLSNEQRLEWEHYSTENQDWIHSSYKQAVPDYQGHPSDIQLVPAVVWSLNSETGVPERDPGPAPYLPLWQVSPPPPINRTGIINHDILSSTPEYAAAAQYALQTSTQTLSRPVTPDSNLFVDIDMSEQQVSVVMEPVLSGFDINARVLGLISALVPWSAYFTNLLPEDSEPMVVVVESCGTNNTFVLRGPEATLMGRGDLHDPSYDSYEVIAPFVVDTLAQEETSTLKCEHTMHIFPTEELESSFKTNTPLAYTLIVMGVFVFAIIVFFIYDLVATIRQNKTKAAAERTDAIIAQIFPTRIREQLFMSGALAGGGQSSEILSTEEERAGLKKGISIRKVEQKSNRRRGRHGMGKERSSESLLEFMNQGKEEEARRVKASRAIADLYPETTIMFADIAGFAAWSSIREPAHVFMLLEAVFQTFDEIANRRRVFKIETVGDCYVAAVGVPDACAEHAIVMARFARECMKKFHITLQNLEYTLGPDTVELGLRVGLHSGPVTAGVLRGDRARFQLFGDTMNTTARVQTTGQRDCIHVSEQTANLITEAGKRKWLISREDQVQAKGKGYLNTFWLKSRKTRFFDDSANGSDFDTDHSESDSSYVSFSENSSMSEVDLMDSESLLKTMDQKLSGNEERKSLSSQRNKQKGINDRLVMWNAELLAQLLRQIVAKRDGGQDNTHELDQMALRIGTGKMVVEETAEIIELPGFNEYACTRKAADVELEEEILTQLRDYVATIADMYRDNHFHNFEHASHVTMSVSKLLSRIVAPQIAKDLSVLDRKEQLLHDHTYGITGDPLTQFAVVLSALIHDVDHRGVPNFQLAREDRQLAAIYQSKSIAEQNSVDLAWEALMADKFKELRACIFGSESELKRFRQLLVNSVIATDIFDKELGMLRKNRWKKAFEEKDISDTSEDINRKATIVIEHIIQASDVSHTMQHWQVYLKWNSRLFMEMYEAFLSGRSDKDPSQGWYEGEIGFFKNYIIPLAKKLKQCGVFGVSSDEYLNYAEMNLREWESKGLDVVADLVARVHEENCGKNASQFSRRSFSVIYDHIQSRQSTEFSIRITVW